MRLNKIFLPMMVLLLMSQLSLGQVKDNLGGSPTKIAKWLKNNIKITKDEVSYAQTAQETFSKRTGDCEDFSILAQYLVGKTYKTFLIAWKGRFREDSTYYEKHKEEIYHCICIVKHHDELWGCIDIDRYIFGKATLVGIIKEDCQLRRVDIEKAYFVRRDEKGKIRIISKIDLNDYYKVY